MPPLTCPPEWDNTGFFKGICANVPLPVGQDDPCAGPQSSQGCHDAPKATVGARPVQCLALQEEENPALLFLLTCPWELSSFPGLEGSSTSSPSAPKAPLSLFQGNLICMLKWGKNVTQQSSPSVLISARGGNVPLCRGQIVRTDALPSPMT